jgi:hypothetical protein
MEFLILLRKRFCSCKGWLHIVHGIVPLKKKNLHNPTYVSEEVFPVFLEGSKPSRVPTMHGKQQSAKQRRKQFHGARIESCLVPDVDPCCSRAPINRRAPLPCPQSIGRLMPSSTMPAGPTAQYRSASPLPILHVPRRFRQVRRPIFIATLGRPSRIRSQHRRANSRSAHKDHIHPQLSCGDQRGKSDQEFKTHTHSQWLWKKPWIAT